MSKFEERSRTRCSKTVSRMDFAMRSRLTQARNAARGRFSTRPWFPHRVLAPAGVRRGSGRVPVGAAIGQHAVT